MDVFRDLMRQQDSEYLSRYPSFANAPFNNFRTILEHPPPHHDETSSIQPRVNGPSRVLPPPRLHPFKRTMKPRKSILKRPAPAALPLTDSNLARANGLSNRSSSLFAEHGSVIRPSESGSPQSIQLLLTPYSSLRCTNPDPDLDNGATPAKPAEPSRLPTVYFSAPPITPLPPQLVKTQKLTRFEDRNPQPLLLITPDSRTTNTPKYKFNHAPHISGKPLPPLPSESNAELSSILSEGERTTTPPTAQRSISTLSTPSESESESSIDSSHVSPSRASRDIDWSTVPIELFYSPRPPTTNEALLVPRPDRADRENRNWPIFDLVDLGDLDITGEVVKSKQVTLGGRSDVYRGSIVVNGTTYERVIKSLRERGSSGNPADEERLRQYCYQQILLWRFISHPNILHLYGFSMPPNEPPSLVSRWYINGNVLRYLELHPDIDRHALALDVVNGLVYLHSVQVAHGNLQGENVLVDDQGQARLCGFTMSRFVDEMPGLKINTNNGGATRFMCPELLGAEPKLTTATDIWALGCLIVEIIAGIGPYQDLHTVEDVKCAIVRGDLPSTNGRGVIAPDLWDCIKKCWSVMPQDRPKASEVALHLTRAMSDGLDISDLDLSGKITTTHQTHWGNFSDVWRGTMLTEAGQTDVALKALRIRQSGMASRQTSVEERLQKRFKREVSLWRRLLHPNIVPLLGYTMHCDGLPTLVSPWYANGNLIEYLKSDPPPNRYSLASDITRAMQYLHSIPVVHGDIKGENVLVNSSGSASLCDFGMSQLLDEALHITGFTTTNANAGGTDRYLCPELMEDAPKTTTTDIWAFASLIVLTLTDQIPYHSIIKRHILPAAIMRGDPPNTNADGIIDEALWSCLAKCWSINPEARPNISDLASYILPLTSVRTLKSLVRSQVLKGYNWPISSVHFSPKGDCLAIAAVSPHAHQVSVQLVQVGGRQVVCYIIDASKLIQTHIIWSPPGNYLAITTGDDHVYILEVKAECTLRRFLLPDRVNTVAWLLGGTHVACSGSRALYIMDVNGVITATCHYIATMKICKMTFISDNICVLLEEGLTENKMIVYNTKKSQMEHASMSPDTLHGITLSKDAQHLLVTHSQYPELWKTHFEESGDPRLSLLQAYKADQGHPISPAALSGGLGDQFVICAFSTGVIHFWDRNNGTQLHSIQPWSGEEPYDFDMNWDVASTETSMFATWRGGNSVVEIWSTPDSNMAIAESDTPKTSMS